MSSVRFRKITDLVISWDCLMTLTMMTWPDNKIFVTCNTSDRRTGAVLSYGATWETVRPVAFDSMVLKLAQLNYPVHEKELLAIIQALQKWWSELLGAPIIVYTEHRTLENFDEQKRPFVHQARWQEFMAQYNLQIVYIPEESNTVADALSHLPDSGDETNECLVASLLTIHTDPSLLDSILKGYESDPFCVKISNV